MLNAKYSLQQWDNHRKIRQKGKQALPNYWHTVHNTKEFIPHKKHLQGKYIMKWGVCQVNFVDRSYGNCHDCANVHF